MFTGTTPSRRSMIGGAAAFALLASALGTAPARANDAAVALVRSVSDQVVQLIRSPGDRAGKEAAFRRIMEQSSDLRQIAGFAAGRFARSMSPEQRDRYVDAFSSFIARTYVARFDEYQGESIAFGNVRDGGNRGVLVQSQVERPGEPSLGVDWLVSDRSGRWLITDIQVEGISMAQSQRSEFTSMINERGGDIERFIADLKARGAS